MKLKTFSFVLLVSMVVPLPESGFSALPEPGSPAACKAIDLKSYKEYFYLSSRDQKYLLSFHRSTICDSLQGREDDIRYMRIYKKKGPFNAGINRLYCGPPIEEDYWYWKFHGEKPPEAVRKFCRDGGAGGGNAGPQKIKPVTTEVFCWRVEEAKQGVELAFIEGLLEIKIDQAKRDRYQEKLSPLCENARNGKITLKQGYHEYEMAGQEIAAFIAGAAANKGARALSSALNDFFTDLGLVSKGMELILKK